MSCSSPNCSSPASCSSIRPSVKHSTRSPRLPSRRSPMSGSQGSLMPGFGACARSTNAPGSARSLLSRRQCGRPRCPHTGASPFVMLCLYRLSDIRCFWVIRSLIGKGSAPRQSRATPHPPSGASFRRLSECGTGGGRPARSSGSCWSARSCCPNGPWRAARHDHASPRGPSRR